MLLRKSRWVAAGLVAVAAILTAPARSQADIQVWIFEVGSGAPAQTFTLSGTGQSTPSISTANFQNITVGVNTSSGSPTASNTLTSTVNLAPIGTLTTEHTLRVIVKDNGFLTSNPAGPATLTNNAGTSAGIVGTGTNEANVTTELIASVGANAPLASATIDQDGNVIVAPPGSPVAISALDGSFTLQQTINIVAAPSGSGIEQTSTLGGTLSSKVTSTPAQAPVPAPAGVILGLLAIPALGLRRVFRRSPEAAV